VARDLHAFLRTRNGVIATIGIVIILVAAIFAITWTVEPGFYVGLGLRHDPSLDSYVSALHSVALEQHPQNLTAWSVTWLNSTAVRVSWAYTYLGPGNETSNQTSNQTKIILYSESFVMTDFYGATTASAYVGSVNSTYKLMTTTYGAGGAYQQAFGRPPSTFAAYQDKAGQGNFIWQLDQFVQVGSLTRTYSS
jgi:hypothetical protein